MRDQPIRPDVPGDMSTCAKNHVRVYWDGGNRCPVCEEQANTRAVEKEAMAEMRDMQRGGGRW